MAQLYVPLFAMIILTLSTVINTMANTSLLLSPHLRRRHRFPSRNLRPHPSSGHHSTYKGCLAYSDTELNWIFPGQAPSCSWVHSGSSSSGGSGSGSSGGSSAGSNGCSYGDDDNGDGDGYWKYDDEIEYSDEQYDDSVVENGNGDNDSNNGNGVNGGDNSDDNSSGGYGDDQVVYTDDEVIVSNEDVSNGDSEYDPIDDFEIEMCNTYENLWLWDLSLSCDMTGGDLSLNDCNCTFAQELMDNELLSCDDAALCPGDCLICFTCLKLLGCDIDSKPPGISQSVSTAVMLYVVAAAVALLLFALAAYYARRKWQEDHDLNRNLIEKQKHGIIVEDGPSFMYINGDLTWKPLPSDQQYAAQQIQPVCTMSTASTGRYLEERVQPSNTNSGSEEEKESFSDNGKTTERLCMSSSYDHEKVPSVVETLDTIENRVVSSIQTDENSSNEDDHVFEDTVQSPISMDDCDDVQKQGDDE